MMACPSLGAAADWAFKGEGNANVVYQYVGRLPHLVSRAGVPTATHGALPSPCTPARLRGRPADAGCRLARCSRSVRPLPLSQQAQTPSWRRQCGSRCWARRRHQVATQWRASCSMCSAASCRCLAWSMCQSRWATNRCKSIVALELRLPAPPGPQRRWLSLAPVFTVPKCTDTGLAPACISCAMAPLSPSAT